MVRATRARMVAPASGIWGGLGDCFVNHVGDYRVGLPEGPAASKQGGDLVGGLGST